MVRRPVSSSSRLCTHTKVLIKHGFDVDFVSDTGSYGWDNHSLAPDFLNGEDKEIFYNKQYCWNELR